MPAGIMVGDEVGPMIANSRDLVAEASLLSVTFTLKENVPAEDGWPSIIPSATNESPGHKAPSIKLQLYGGVPPKAVSVNI
jgi:hypothetical protein